jgi:hypothetical protein
VKNTGRPSPSKSAAATDRGTRQKAKAIKARHYPPFCKQFQRSFFSLNEEKKANSRAITVVFIEEKKAKTVYIRCLFRGKEGIGYINFQKNLNKTRRL